MMGELDQKRCVPCRGDLPPLSRSEVDRLLMKVPGWALSGDEPLRIRREFKFKNFKEALAFVNRVGAVAESEGHHPNITIHSWNRVLIELYTHKINGLHENDFVMAAKIEKIFT